MIAPGSRLLLALYFAWLPAGLPMPGSTGKQA